MSMKTAKSQLSSGKIRSAGKTLDGLLSEDPEKDELWYLRGIVALKLKNYDGAMEYFSRAALLRKKAKYVRMIGLAHMEMYELESAIGAFREALEIDSKDALSAFFLSVCYMFFDNPLALEYIRMAYRIDKKKTKRLLNNFYTAFFGGKKKLDAETREKILETLKED